MSDILNMNSLGENIPVMYVKIPDQIMKELDLLDNSKTFKYLEKNKPDYIFNCAALVGGIKYNNDYPVDFLYKNITMQNNLIMSVPCHRVVSKDGKLTGFTSVGGIKTKKKLLNVEQKTRR